MAVAGYYNVNRSDARQRVFVPADFMRPWRRAESAKTVPAAQGMRPAKAGERPPSRYQAGVDDGVIQKFDAYARRVQ